MDLFSSFMRILLSFLQMVQIEWGLYQQTPVEPAFYFGHTCGIVHGLSARGLHTLLPPRYLVFFKAPDAEAFNSAFKEYSASLLNKGKRPSVLAKLH
ncbi:PcfB family protein, partial [Faecalibacterium prausnitzii]|uniref:PcfB family protein n=1 Tax=Faecalibacterium prausnitzii TaxID=853 RepID=UPI003F1D2B6D